MNIAARPLALAAAALAAAALAGCGKLGALERPGALEGQPAAQTAPDPSRAVKTVDPRDAATLPTPRQ